MAARPGASASSHAARSSRASRQPGLRVLACGSARRRPPRRAGPGRGPGRGLVRRCRHPGCAAPRGRRWFLRSLIWWSHTRAAASVSSAPRALRVAARNCLWRASLPAASARGSASACARSTRSRSVSYARCASRSASAAIFAWSAAVDATAHRSSTRTRFEPQGSVPGSDPARHAGRPGPARPPSPSVCRPSTRPSSAHRALRHDREPHRGRRDHDRRQGGRSPRLRRRRQDRCARGRRRRPATRRA